MSDSIEKMSIKNLADELGVSKIKESEMVAVLEMRCNMDKIDLREETVDRIELMYERLADYLNLPDEDNYSEMIERMMDVLNSTINVGLANSSLITDKFVYGKIAETEDESEKEFWLNILTYVMQLNQIGVIYRNESKGKEL